MNINISLLETAASDIYTLSLHDALPILQGQHVLVRTELHLEGRHAVGLEGHLLGQFHGNHIAGLHVQDVAHTQLAAGHGALQRHLDVEDVLAQRLGPALVLITDVGLEAGVEHFADRLEHRVRQGHVQVAAAAVQLDVEGGDHHHFAGADDVGDGRVDLRVEVLEVHLQQGLPGFLQVDERLIQHHAHHPQLSGGEFATFDLGVTPIAAEEVVHQLEHQARVKDEQRDAAQRLHLHQIEAGRYVQRMHVLAELHHLHTAYRDIRRAAQQVEHADPGVAGKTLVDHFQGRHASANDTILTGQVVALDASLGGQVLGIDETIIDAMQQGVDFIL